MNRSGISRLETRSSRANKDEMVKRVMLTVERVRKWEKKWVDADIDGCTLKTYKWVPVAKDEVTQPKVIPKDNLSDVSSTTSSPLPLEENNPNSGNIPGKTSEVQKPSKMVVTSSSSEVPQHANRGDEHYDSPTLLPVDGEDSNLTPSIASEDSTSLMYQIGMNVGGENEDSRQSFQSATDSENSTEHKSPVEASKAPEISLNDKNPSTKVHPNNSNTAVTENSNEPPAKRLREDQT